MENTEKPQEKADVLNENIEETPKKKKKKAKKIILITLSAILFVIVAGILILNFYIDSIMNLRVEGPHVKETYASSIHDEDDVYNIAVLGRNLASTKYIHPDVQTNSVKVVSLDFHNKRMVISNVNAYPMAYSPVYKDLLNFGQLYVRGGADDFVGSLNYDFDLNIDRYIIISWTVNLFAQCIDILGGVDVDLNQAELNYLKMDGKPGTYHLNGEKAMEYTEYMRYTIESEEAKIIDRRTIVFNKCLELMKKASIFQLIELARAAMPYVETDLSNWEIKELMVKIISFQLYHRIISIRYPETFADELNFGKENKPIFLNYEYEVKRLQDNIYLNKDYKSTENIKMIANKFNAILKERGVEVK